MLSCFYLLSKLIMTILALPHQWDNIFNNQQGIYLQLTRTVFPYADPRGVASALNTHGSVLQDSADHRRGVQSCLSLVSAIKWQLLWSGCCCWRASLLHTNCNIPLEQALWELPCVPDSLSCFNQICSGNRAAWGGEAPFRSTPCPPPRYTTG